MAGGVLDVPPEPRPRPAVLPIPVARLEFTRQLTANESLAPPAEGESVEVADEDAVQLLVAEVRLDPLRPVPPQVVVTQRRSSRACIVQAPLRRRRRRLAAFEEPLQLLLGPKQLAA